MLGAFNITAIVAAASGTPPAPPPAVFDTLPFDDVLFDTGVAIANVPPFSDGIFDTVLFDVGAAASNPLYLGADGESVIRLGTRSASALYLGPRTLF